MTKPEDMTIDEIREQLALYNRLYYNKRREDKEYLDKKRASRDRYLEKKKIEKLHSRKWYRYFSREVDTRTEGRSTGG